LNAENLEISKDLPISTERLINDLRIEGFSFVIRN